MQIALEESTLRIIVGVVGGLAVVTRIIGVINPEKVKKLAGSMAGWKPGWIRFLYLIVGLFGLWVLYSALFIIFREIPVFMVISFMLGLLLLASGMFIVHPQWFTHITKGLLVERGDFFVRVLCFIGMLAGIFILLTAIFGPGWGGS